MKIFTVAKGSTGFEGLKRGERDRPTAGPGQVLVRMRAASLNFRDLAIIAGKYFRGPVERDTIPLSDGAGEVAEVGTGVKQFAIGDRVVASFTQGNPPAALGLPLDGCLTEYAVFPADGLLRVPSHLSFEEAATLPCAGVTVWNALMHGPKSLKPGETVLALGTGGVAIFALQIGKLAGARVIITSSSDEKLARAKSLGALHTINYKSTPDWDKAALDLTGGYGVDHVVEVGGARTIERALRAVRIGGRVSVIGVLTGAGEINPTLILGRRANVQGMSVGSVEMFEAMNRAIAAAKLKPEIDKVFAFDEARAAFRHLESAKHFGKIVVRVA